MGRFCRDDIGDRFRRIEQGEWIGIASCDPWCFFIRIYPADRQAPTKQKLSLGAANHFLVTYAGIVPYFGQYWGRYARTGDPFVINVTVPLFPDFWVKTYKRRPGVISIADSLLTFRFISLLRDPFINSQAGFESDHIITDFDPRPEIYETEANPIHRRSIWTQLYARTHFVHFDGWPTGWFTLNPWVHNLGRAIFLLALLPSGIWLWGLWINFVSLYKHNGSIKVSYLERAIYYLIVGGFLTFLVYYALRYRDFATFKAIFFYPGLIGFSYFCAIGVELLQRKINREAYFVLLYGVLVALLGLYCIDILYLIGQLSF